MVPFFCGMHFLSKESQFFDHAWVTAGLDY